MKNITLVFLGIVCCLQISDKLNAQNISWSEIDTMFGGGVMDMVVHPTDSSIVFVCNYNGLFKTTDGGGNWIKTGTGLPEIGESPLEAFDNYPVDIDISKSDPNKMYLFTNTSVLYKSNDTGDSWNFVTSDINAGRVDSKNSIAIDPANSSIIYIASQDGLYKSTDDGASFSIIRNSASGIFINKNNSNFLLCIDDDSLYKSTSGGVTWENISNLSEIGSLSKAGVDPGNEDIIYYSYNGWSSVRKSIDGGSTWSSTSMSGGFGFSIANQNPDIIYSSDNGLFRSDDKALTNKKIYTCYGAVSDIVPSGNDSIVYASVPPGKLIKSTDYGETWSVMQNGLKGYIPNYIHFPSVSSDTVFLATRGGGIYFSPDTGNTWIQREDQIFHSRNILQVITEPGNHQNVIILAGNAYSESGKVYLSNDGGMTFNDISPLNSAEEFHSVIWTTTGNIFIGSTENGIYKSVNAGSSWTQVNQGLTIQDVRVLAVHPANPDTVFAGTHGGGIYKTTNGGESWTSASEGIGNLNIKSIAINSDSPDILYAGTIDGIGAVYKSINGGANWAVSNKGLPDNANIFDLTLDPDDNDILYLSAQDTGIMVSVNSGETWNYLSGATPDKNIINIAKHKGKLYAATRTKGLYSGRVFLIKSIEETNITCKDDEDGTIIINLFGGASPFQYSIDNGTTFQSNNSFGNLLSGEYQIVVKDVNGSSVSWDKDIVIEKPDTVDLGNDQVIYKDETTTLDAGTGYMAYKWSDDSEEQTLEVDGSLVEVGEHEYWVSVTDDNSCTSSDTILITIKEGSGIQDPEDMSVKLYPNPTLGEVNLVLPYSLTDFTVSIINTNGKIVWESNMEKGIQNITLPMVESGVYYMKIESGNFIKTEKLLIR